MGKVVYLEWWAKSNLGDSNAIKCIYFKFLKFYNFFAHTVLTLDWLFKNL